MDKSEWNKVIITIQDLINMWYIKGRWRIYERKYELIRRELKTKEKKMLKYYQNNRRKKKKKKINEASANDQD